VRALERFRWVLPALAMPVCVATAGVLIQAAAFGHAPKDALVATGALRELVRYRVMRGTESIGKRTIPATCVQGWFRAPGRGRLLPGALVLLGNGERLYDLGTGIRLAPKTGPTRPAGVAGRAQFMLAGCPRFIGNRFARDLLHGNAVRALSLTADGTTASAIVASRGGARLTLDVTPTGDEPLELSWSDGRLRGSSDLVPGGGAPAIRRVRRAFDLSSGHRRRNA
jgi:hypothetical protein